MSTTHTHNPSTPKIAYGVSTTYRSLRLLEYDVLASYKKLESPATKNYVVATRAKIIWSSKETEVGDPVSDSWTTKDKLFTDLREAKLYLEKKLKVTISSRTEVLGKAQKSLEIFQQIKIENLPQDEYFSPFTGKKA